VTIAEISAGIARLNRLGSTARAVRLKDWLDRILCLYADRVLPFETSAAEIAGALGDAATAAGRHPGFPDIVIAAIAKSRDLAVLTMNTRHFEPLSVELLSPIDVV
jgi:toxin FitB